ncbi:MAG: DUF1704 domain-containing protein [Myxococcales bacterium]|nr:DUF1704 domain-containing protein [Myxococcales bacterium]
MPRPPAIRRRGPPNELPTWLVRAERLLIEASRTVRLLGAVTPRNAAVERARLAEQFASGATPSPRWSYARTDHSALRTALDRAARRLSAESHPVAQLYGARARELELEAALASEVGTSVFGALARARFSATTAAATTRASALAAEWIANVPSPSEEPTIPSDAPVPESLFSRMREEVSRLRLPFAVVVQPSLSALAATGERHILVASGRKTTREDVERTVMHEIEAHAIPRTRAQSARLAIFQLGTARGIDDQEGLALVLEERHDHLTTRRRHALAARQVAVELMDDGASFVDVVTRLSKEHGVELEHALAVAERAFRGGDGVSPGLGRERVYLDAFLRVRTHLRAHPTDEGILTSGQVSLDAIATLTPFVQRRTEPPPRPPSTPTL